MTAATSVFGQLPLVVMPGAGSELYRGLGAVVLGGIVVSTIFTLLLTPLVFAYAIEVVQSVRVKFGMPPMPGMAQTDREADSAD
jgi:HAE1 family hydrophobic/amphiphilic exporter-1